MNMNRCLWVVALTVCFTSAAFGQTQQTDYVQLLLNEIRNTTSLLGKFGAKQDELQRQIREIQRFQIPRGAVIAFTSERCPEGWSRYSDVDGRMIVGVGRRAGASKEFIYSFKDTGGEEEHTLTIAELPGHSHNSNYALNGQSLPWGPGSHPIPTSAANKGAATDWIAGGGQPHNNMPPYIALHFCKKN